MKLGGTATEFGFDSSQLVGRKIVLDLTENVVLFLAHQQKRAILLLVPNQETAIEINVLEFAGEIDSRINP